MSTSSRAALRKRVVPTGTANETGAAREPDANPAHTEGPASAKPPVEPDHQDALALQSLLKEQFTPADETGGAAPPPAKPVVLRPETWHFKSRFLKSIAGLALLAMVGWMPMQRLFQVASVEAVVNAPLVTIRAPISGMVDAGSNALKVGETVSAGAPLASLSNPRADRNGVDNAADKLQQARDERGIIVAKLNSFKSLRADLDSRLSKFHANRMRLVNSQVAAADAQITSALAIEKRADATLRRQMMLTGQGLLAPSTLEDATRDVDVAGAATSEARARKAALAVEAEALMSGSFFGDSYNDQPQSAQQLDELDQQIASLEAEIAGQDQRIASAAAAFRREQNILSQSSGARVLAPVRGQVWEILAAPGEQVVAGQEIGSVLDCSQALVTAAVSEAVYNSLSLGMPATFTFREGGPSLPGRVAQLSGVASASSNFAIMPSALTKESYRVAIAVQGASPDGSCAVGRTGRVVFQTSK